MLPPAIWRVYNGEETKKKSMLDQRFLALLAAIAILVTMPAGSLGKAHGAERRTVRVGFFPMEGYNEISADGSRAGMDVEYLEALCDYVSWNIEYVDCASWEMPWTCF